MLHLSQLPDMTTWITGATGRIRPWMIGCTGLIMVVMLTFVGCQTQAGVEDHAKALAVIKKLRQQIHRENYQGALKCFTHRSQQKIFKVGGPGTPLDSFFRALKPALEKQINIRDIRGKVWMTYQFPDGEQLLVALIDSGNGKWVITSMHGDGWRV